MVEDFNKKEDQLRTDLNSVKDIFQNYKNTIMFPLSSFEAKLDYQGCIYYTTEKVLERAVFLSNNPDYITTVPKGLIEEYGEYNAQVLWNSIINLDYDGPSKELEDSLSGLHKSMSLLIAATSFIYNSQQKYTQQNNFDYSLDSKYIFQSGYGSDIDSECKLHMEKILQCEREKAEIFEKILLSVANIKSGELNGRLLNFDNSAVDFTCDSPIDLEFDGASQCNDFDNSYNKYVYSAICDIRTGVLIKNGFEIDV